ncbi:dTDP-4-dehydrorhamnose reductase [Leptospira bandrabouensis]|uniref:dTDP-4-dehydrorhamnose reductase n=1 Tax=Leptospira bandrabouensis TaxID=2484903 RepID=A0A6H3NKT3_9LEPT|nr:dTDP-4-dehydrorhamnose reductase [Leptospira bandrabouensis]MCG6144908.1 dTDP-4-dehydrorhamnose reductase [Leptospira bandrabouensis]MCG6152923.1 dTDP-4-dehydrorhamnose reductase [Leptospira bandrabouensis]MCG6160455.1 dTDP-4-dehydrorhamnose reductase [Leptospira bandrabouensis]MCG6164387.1 dTDP-4-dehydrorhamnose reductase [Leptospira bandrabouensis]MCW7460374.1 dTDP-4-dehydrorhamnose reductase [Leptospira bandrabouensis]
MKTILVTGSNGQVGNELKVYSNQVPNYNFIFLDRELLDIAEEGALSEFISKNQIESEIIAVINAAAYTAVDLAEKEEALAYAVNTLGPYYLAKETKKLGIKFVHISTDYVFDGKNWLPYLETDVKNPLSVYGKTKSKGEDLVMQEDADAIIIRTSWVYSKFGKNFFKTIAKLGREKKQLNVVDDQIGTPTWAGDIARASFLAAISKQKGIYHFTNEGIASWYDFAFEIIKEYGLSCSVIPVSTKDYGGSLVDRPHYSVLNKQKFFKDFEFEKFHWRTRLSQLVLDSAVL